MRNLFSSLLITLLVLLVCLSHPRAQQKKQTTTKPNYLFAYFKNNGEDGLHLAYSHDGLRWEALNDDQPYLTPLVGSQKLMRDPCILLGPDGIFHMVWTTGWRGQDIGIAHSKDLIRWSEQKALPVMAHEPAALNCWAPEIFYDDQQKQYLIFWATTIPGRFPATETSGDNGLNRRIYYVTTKDFVHYSKAALLYDDGFNVIDATIVKQGRQYVMILKDETQNPVKKHLRLAVSDKATGPYSKASVAFTPNWVETPTAIKIKNEWLVYFDMYRDRRYGAVKTSDWQNWELVTDHLVMPPGARHGTVFTISDEVFARLRLRWADCLAQEPEWYSSDEALRIADNLLLYQRDSGGWPKNVEMATVLSEQRKTEIARQKSRTDCTIDNGATWKQIQFLARVLKASKQAIGLERFKTSFLRGLDYLLQAQYDNGGWPQFYPNPRGYEKHITFNDDAMIGVMNLLREVARRSSLYEFVDEARRQQADRAVQKGIECILRTQVVVDGQRTVWCAQHDEVTLAPRAARSYEKASLSGSESVGIVRFLMGIEKPSLQIIEAIEAAIAWFAQTKLTGIKVIAKPDASMPRGYDRVVVADPQAPPLWARFYEIGTNRPIFSGRDGVTRYSLAEIEPERRTGYAWYTDAPAALLQKDYPAWLRRRR